jgi:hypothetical protein
VVVDRAGVWERLSEGFSQAQSEPHRSEPPRAERARPGKRAAQEGERRVARAHELVRRAAATAWWVLRLALIALAALVATSLGTRTWLRRRRLRRIGRWEVRLGREDLATPYQREKMLEAWHGQLAARWWTRLVVGQPSISLEVHHLPDGTQRFTLAAEPRQIRRLEGRLLATYPDVRLVPTEGAPRWGRHVIRLKKRRLFVDRIQTIKDDEQALCESIVSTMARIDELATVQLVLTPAPWIAHRFSRRLLKGRERELARAERRDPAEIGVDSVVEEKELKGALETQHRSLYWTEVRVSANSYQAAYSLAGLFSELRSENTFVQRHARLRASIYRRRVELAAANPFPGFLRGVLSCSELAAVWSLPRQRAKAAQLMRAATRHAHAPPQIARDPQLAIMRDERGPVGLFPADRKYGQAFIGGQGVGKTSGIARTIAIDAQDRDAALIELDAVHDLAEYSLTLIPEDRTVWYFDLGRPEVGINPLRIAAPPSAVADVLMQALKEAHEPGAILSQSDEFLRNAALAVCAVEPEPTLWQMYELLSPRRVAYREAVVGRLEGIAGMDAVARYWGTTFPERWMDSRTHMTGQLAAPLNKINRLLTTPSVDVALRHPFALDIARVIREREVLIVNGALGEVGEQNAVVVLQIVLQLIHQAMKQQQRLPESERVRVCLKIDEAHLVLTPSFATMLALHRAAGPLEVTAAWQYSAQVEDRAIRSGLKSLLRSRSMFAMGEVSDAREQAEVAMEVYTDLIRSEREERERMRFGPEDIVRLPTFTAINSWVADGARQTAFLAQTTPMRDLGDGTRRELHLRRQREAGAHWPAVLPAPVQKPRAPVRVESELPASGIVEQPERNGGDEREHEQKETEAPDLAAVAPAPKKARRERADEALGAANPGPGTYTAVHRGKVTGIGWDPLIEARRSDAFEFRPRDGEILRALWRYELLLVSQIWQEWWSDHAVRAAQTRLKLLRELGWVRRFRLRVSSGSHEAGYALTKAGFQAAQRHHGPDGPYIGEEVEWKERQPVDHRTVQHLLQMNAWALVYRRLAGDIAIDWQGEHEGRLELPTKIVERRRAPITLDDVRLDHYQRVRDLKARALGQVWPDATVTLALPESERRFDLLIELDRTDRPNRNFQKFVRYDALITAWWRKLARYQEMGEPPVAVFVCSDEAHALSFMRAADRQVTGRLASPGTPEASWPYPGRERMLFVAERDVHEGNLRAWKLPAEPVGATDSAEPAVREVCLPGAR